MHRSTETTSEKYIEKFDQWSKILQTSKAMQRRFSLIPESALNDVVVAGVRDNKLGRVKDGKTVGANIIRFCNPSPNTKSDFHRICIDPQGVSNKANPHIPVSPGTIKTAENIQKGMKVFGKVVLFTSIVASGVRIAKTIHDEVKIDDEINAMENIASCLKEDLEDCNEGDSAERNEIAEALKFTESFLADARDCKLNQRKKTVLTGLCIAGEWCGAAAFGYAGAEVGAAAFGYVGTQAGAALGTVAGPVGAVLGSVMGSVIGNNIGNNIGAFASSKLGSFISR